MTAPFKPVAGPLRIVPEADRPNLGDLFGRANFHRIVRAQREAHERSRSSRPMRAGYQSEFQGSEASS